METKHKNKQCYRFKSYYVVWKQLNEGMRPGQKFDIKFNRL